MRILCLLLLLVGCSGAAHEPVNYFSVQTPRPFGYVLGDEIEQKIMFEIRPGVSFQVASLPGTGQLNRWLNLNRVEIRQIEQRYEIVLRYQVFYAALEVKALKLPGFSLQFNEQGQTFSKEVPAWEFNMSPLRELAVRKTEQGEYMRSDAQPPLLSDRSQKLGFYAATSIAALSASYLAYLYGYLSLWQRRRLFKRALRKLTHVPANNIGQALTIVHQALNSLNRQPLFAHQLSDFYRLYPQYQCVNSELDWFFNFSNHYFFSDGFSTDSLDLEKIKTLCRHCREIERGSR
ncbi:MAG: nonribosomal peptide synthetase MxaA [Methylococcales bacterium]